MSKKASSGNGLPAAYRVAFVWAGLSMVGVLFAMPFLLTLLEGLNAPNLPPWPILTIVLVLQTGLGSCFLAWGGIAAGRKLGVGSPLIEAYLSHRRSTAENSFGMAALLGAAGGLSVLILNVFFVRVMPAPMRSIPQPTPFQGLLASVYGGISEEVLMRLGVTTIAAWIISKVSGNEGRGRQIALWFGVVFGALMFGVGHLPLAFTLWPASPVVVARILVLNGIVGVLAGMVYIRRGLEHAVVLHWAADIILYVLLPLVAAARGA